MFTQKQKRFPESMLSVLFNSLLFLLLIQILILSFPWLCRTFYRIINKVDTSIYTRYATNNKFDKDVYFSNEINDKFAIIDQLENEIIEFNSCSNLTEFAQTIIDNQTKVSAIIAANTDYSNYLNSIDTTISDIIEWATAISQLDLNVGTACIYLEFLAFDFIFILVFKNRKTFYTAAGFIYALSVLSNFSHGLSDYLTPHVINFISKLFPTYTNVLFSYNDMLQQKLLLRQPYVESLLTFIIFDTTIQLLQNQHEEKRKYAINYLSYFLSMQIFYLSQFNDNITRYITPIYECNENLSEAFDTISAFCNKRIIICNLKLSLCRLLSLFNLTFLYDSEFMRDFRLIVSSQQSDMQNLCNLLHDLTSNTACTTEERLQKLHAVQNLIHKYKFI